MGVVEDIQNIDDDDHETMGSCGKTNNKPRAATSSTQTYIDEVCTYKNEDEESKLNPDIRSFIDTSNSLSSIVSERDMPEKPEIDIKDDTNNSEEYNKGSGDHETDDSIDIDDSTRGAKISDPARGEVEVKSRDTSLRDELVDDNINDDSRIPKDTIRKDDRDVKPTEKAIKAADRSLLDNTGNNVEELNKKRHIVRTWDSKTAF